MQRQDMQVPAHAASLPSARRRPSGSLRQGVASSPVVAYPGLVLAFSAPAGPGPDRAGVWHAELVKAGVQAADLR
jgi:hypothetical protein